MVTYSKQFLGNPYVWGGTSLTNGTDCSGFVQSLYAHFGYAIPRDSRSQAAGAAGITQEEMQPGDLLFYSRGGSINHVAMYIGTDRSSMQATPKQGLRFLPMITGSCKSSELHLISRTTLRYGGQQKRNKAEYMI